MNRYLDPQLDMDAQDTARLANEARDMQQLSFPARSPEDIEAQRQADLARVPTPGPCVHCGIETLQHVNGSRVCRGCYDIEAATSWLGRMAR